MMTHTQARTIAEAAWGRGGTTSYRTNRFGAFYFSCSSHGGFVIDARALSDDQYIAISKYVRPEQATAYGGSLMHPFRRYRLRTAHPPKPFKFFMLEEDCDWCLAPLFAGINLIHNPFSDDQAQRTFDRWISSRQLAST